MSETAGVPCMHSEWGCVLGTVKSLGALGSHGGSVCRGGAGSALEVCGTDWRRETEAGGDKPKSGAELWGSGEVIGQRVRGSRKGLGTDRLARKMGQHGNW